MFWPEVAMARNPSTTEEANQAFVRAWDAEIDAEEAEERELRAKARADERGRRLKDRGALATVSGALLRVAGVTEAQARELADAELARARKAGTGQHKRAVAAVKKRARASAAETKNLIAGVKRGS
jgi:hypothetical protein